jgi:hypothetical protein
VEAFAIQVNRTPNAGAHSRVPLCGALDDEMLMALIPDYLHKEIAGMEALAKNGLRCPFPQYCI